MNLSSLKASRPGHGGYAEKLSQPSEPPVSTLEGIRDRLASQLDALNKVKNGLESTLGRAYADSHPDMLRPVADGDGPCTGIVGRVLNLIDETDTVINEIIMREEALRRIA